MSEPTCPAESRGRRTRYGETHTVRCVLPEGHDGLHHWHDGAALKVFWGGPAQKAPDNTRMRFGTWLEAK